MGGSAFTIIPLDNGTAQLAVDFDIPKSNGVNVLIVYVMSSQADAYSSYELIVADISAVGVLTGIEATKTGLPVTSSIMTIGRVVSGDGYKIGDWQKEPDGTRVHLKDVVVTLGYNTLVEDKIYVAEQDRSHGIMIYAPNMGLSAVEGQILDVDGVIDTDPITTERRIVQPSAVLKALEIGSSHWV